MSQVQIDFVKKVTDEAIQAAEDHANRVHNFEWSVQADEFLEGYAKINPVFQAEDVRLASEGVVPAPPHARAWGGVIRRAAIKGIIFPAGIKSVRSIHCHGAKAAVWKSMIVQR